MATADYDSDGDPDLFVGGRAVPGQSILAADFNEDGHVDPIQWPGGNVAAYFAVAITRFGTPSFVIFTG